MRKHLRKFFIILTFAAGIFCVAYPFVSNVLAQMEREKVNQEYEMLIQETDPSILENARNEALEYNEKLLHGRVRVIDPFDPTFTYIQEGEYARAMNMAGDGVMGEVLIPQIGIKTPIYHGTEDEVLNKGAGHLTATSLPIGGETSHCVLAGHTGLPTVKVFDALDKLKVGEYFYLDVLGEKHAYKIYDIEVVLPDATDSLVIIPGRDIITLVTCTPYGINSHRLLVHGERTEMPPDAQLETGPLESLIFSMNGIELMVLAGIAALLLLFLAIFIIRRILWKKRGGQKKKKVQGNNKEQGKKRDEKEEERERRANVERLAALAHGSRSAQAPVHAPTPDLSSADPGAFGMLNKSAAQGGIHAKTMQAGMQDQKPSAHLGDSAPSQQHRSATSSFVAGEPFSTSKDGQMDRTKGFLANNNQFGFGHHASPLTSQDVQPAAGKHVWPNGNAPVPNQTHNADVESASGNFDSSAARFKRGEKR